MNYQFLSQDNKYETKVLIYIVSGFLIIAVIGMAFHYCHNRFRQSNEHRRILLESFI